MVEERVPREEEWWRRGYREKRSGGGEVTERRGLVEERVPREEEWWRRGYRALKEASRT